MLRIVLAVIHLLALGIGLGAVWARARALSERPLNRGSARRAITADAWWAFAALLWIGSGLWRLLASTEKATGYYLTNHVFLAKMGILAAILVLEVWPIVTFVRWRRSATRGGSSWTPDLWQATTVRVISYVEAVLVMAMVAAAVMMARGYGASAR